MGQTIPGLLGETPMKKSYRNKSNEEREEQTEKVTREKLRRQQRQHKCKERDLNDVQESESEE
jgi:hypothetical protein